MQRSLLRIAPIPVLSLVLLVAIGGVASARVVGDQPQSIGGDVVSAARQYVQQHAAELGAASAELKLHRRLAFADGEVVVLTQTQNGLPVLGGTVSVLISHGRILLANGELKRVTALDVQPTIQSGQLLQLLRGHRADLELRRSDLAVLADGRGESTLVWVGDAATYRPFGLWRVLIDARSGRVLQVTSTLREAKAKVYSPNPTVNSALSTVELSGLTSDSELTGEYASAKSCMVTQKGYECARNAKPDENGDYLFEPDEPSIEDPFAEVQGYYHADIFHRWLVKRFNFRRPGDIQRIDVNVNLHQTANGRTFGVPNAFFGDIDGDGRGDITFGQGNRDFVYDGDVLYHEFAHSLIDATSDLSPTIDQYGFNIMPLALNESFADLFSSFFTGDGTVGEYAGGLYGNGSIRSLTGTALNCPDGLIGESHEDGLVWGRAVWAIYSQVQNKELFEGVVYKTAISLAKTAGIKDAAGVLSRLAREADPSLGQLVDAELQKRGVDSCTRFVPLTAEKAREGYIFGTSDFGISMVPGPLQYRIEVPKDAEKMQLVLTQVRGRTQTLSALVRKREPVLITGNLLTTKDATVNSGGVPATFERTSSTLPLEPGAVYFVLPINTGASTRQYSLAVAFPKPIPFEPDAGIAPDAGSAVDAQPATDADIVATEDPATAGRGCAVGGPARAGWGVLLGLLLLVIGRRRRSEN